MRTVLKLCAREPAMAAFGSNSDNPSAWRDAELRLEPFDTNPTAEHRKTSSCSILPKRPRQPQILHQNTDRRQVQGAETRSDRAEDRKTLGRPKVVPQPPNPSISISAIAAVPISRVQHTIHHAASCDRAARVPKAFTKRPSLRRKGSHPARTTA